MVGVITAQITLQSGSIFCHKKIIIQPKVGVITNLYQYYINISTVITPTTAEYILI